MSWNIVRECWYSWLNYSDVYQDPVRENTIRKVFIKKKIWRKNFKEPHVRWTDEIWIKLWNSLN